MPTTIINPQKYRKILYETSPRKRKVEIEIEANSPIDIYIVQASDLRDWRASREYGGMSFKARRTLDFQIKMDPEFEDEWYLILENYSDKPVAVHYEVYDV